jgi:uncharacterized SAM-binding protein YcdF (DUF218 family)
MPSVPSSISTKTPRRGRKRRLVTAALLAAVLALGGGFLWYAAQVPDTEASFIRSADGIVAFTGGPERINDAVELLAAGRGKRLLITGVNPTTRVEELSRLVPRYQAMFACCIDLDRSALNTIGNAVETRRWTRDRGFRSLVVVTSSYHMPRALAELSHQLPDVALIPYPVVTEKHRGETWWSSAPAARTLAFEYVKYLVAVARMRVAPGYTGTDESGKT